MAAVFGGSHYYRPHRRVHHRRYMHGDGFFGDLWSGIKKVGEHALPVLKDIGIGLLKKRIGLGRRRRRVHRRTTGGYRRRVVRRPTIGGYRRRRIVRRPTIGGYRRRVYRRRLY